MPDSFHLTPLTGTLLVVLAVLAGHRFRRAWKDKAPGWQLRAWIYGVVAGAGLLALAFIPLLNPAPAVLRVSGQTMGTTYNVTAITSNPAIDTPKLKRLVEQRLSSINARLSNWDHTSEVSRFSASDSLAPVLVSEDLAAVMAAAMQIHRQSDGRLDVTLGPLIDLWGFGPGKSGGSVQQKGVAPAPNKVPTDAAISAAMARVGQDRLLTLDSATRQLSKAQPGININLGAIAKGYGVDAVAQVLTESGMTHYMVEIGGDLVTRGKNPQGEPWRIGIERPVITPGNVQRVVPLTNQGLATSGDYRNYFDDNGVRYSHIIDPQTGRPVTHQTTSVTVIAPNATLADGWATAMLVLGEQAGLDIANRHDLAVLFISRGQPAARNPYRVVQSDAFTRLTAPADATRR